MSKTIGVNVPASSHLVRFDSSTVDKVVDMLLRALQVRHRIRHSHQRGKF